MSVHICLGFALAYTGGYMALLVYQDALRPGGKGKRVGALLALLISLVAAILFPLVVILIKF